MYKTIMMFDTSIVSENLGDFIIMDSVKRQLRTLFPDSFFMSTATHDTIGKEAKAWQKHAEFSFIGGTNLLTDRYRGLKRAQWKLGLSDTSVKGVIGIGVGWKSYEESNRIRDFPMKLAQKIIYKNVLSNKYLHSVRDSYTQKKLKGMGIESINTSCVTMWDLTPNLINKIPTKKADTVVTTITNYWKSPNYLMAYKKLIEILLDNYDKVKLWIQASEDIEIFNSLEVKGASRVEFISPSLKAYDDALSNSVDYIGTRLHAGIRALQHGRRALIIELDNRAREIARDTNLPTVDYRNVDDVVKFIVDEKKIKLDIPFDQIKRWKEQFK
ncbi:polysaccharide pyruvyl transferase family protein [Levilactobacillus brevis]|uniref:polysaccharide pyruvyl transferase family protein n=2 Tax=Levilactobacillus brevis TaxID=1580 RepID=UPI0009E57E64|nr:polysaccharide pyruvyl transferase family protein [Levilactobacillus brevis]MBL3536287.1 polysaccharide pyruvyl transferase family protein [Lactobacillus sp. GPR40-2]MBL3629572.1 polysaccharide pyruvyl transferase family protein [Lactobacillus sp. GPB7-4]MCM6799769.1 polysaccharide pyruvyl transferase family protein [Levilactobacillus brevis]MCM6801532.1 polysaccharide pyruvyl transferase family protein [Levilactobacillus brevis]MCM6804821.1 polysaccharide pyruvyl transferase family protein